MARIPSTIDPEAGKRLELVRKHLGLNQTKMAKALEISQSTVARIEGGTLDLSTDVLKKLYETYGISPQHLIIGDVPMMQEPQKVNSLVRDIPTMRAEIAVLKGQVKMLSSLLAQKNNNTSNSVTKS